VWVNQKSKPAALDRKPDLPYYLNEYVKAFNLLSTRRSSGFGGINPLSMADILAYASAFKIRDLDRFTSHMITMDGELIKFVANRQKAMKNG
jgi:hypothetical protein